MKEDNKKGKESPRKIRVEFEMDAEDVTELLASGKKKARTISTLELDKLGKEGVIKASDYLTQEQIDEVSVAIPSWIRKTGVKVKKAILTPTVQAVVAKAVAQKLSAKEIGEEEMKVEEEERPKD
jgi:hypothetical protein